MKVDLKLNKTSGKVSGIIEFNDDEVEALFVAISQLAPGRQTPRQSLHSAIQLHEYYKAQTK